MEPASNLGFKRAVLAAAVSASLVAAACGSADNNSKGNGLAPGDYTIASADGVSDSVVINGKIAPIRAVNITTPLQSKVDRVAVAPGDRVQAEQFLASMDAAQAQKQLDAQQRQQANAQADAMASVNTAQAQLDALNNSINNGTYPAIASAQSQLNQAQAACNAASGGPAAVVGAVRVATQMAGQISSEVGQAVGGIIPDGLVQSAAPGAPAAPGGQGTGGNGNATGGGEVVPGTGLTQSDVAQILGGAGGTGAGGSGGGISAQDACAAAQEAQASLAAARSQAEQERLQAQAQVDSAWRAADSAQTGDGDGTLEYQVQESTIYAPIAGVVTSVDVQEGDIPQGRVLSLADDSRLLIKADVREADVPNIAKGNTVTFTSTATGKKQYTGRVTRIAPAANSDSQNSAAAAAVAMGQGKESDTVTFPVEIEVTGDTQGLLLGGTVRAEIITAESKNALNVPVDAVYDDGGQKKVLVLATGNDSDRSGKVEERTVETGTSNDVDVAVTGGDLKAGDIVINWPDDYRDRMGQKVEITDSGFDPSAVEQARKTKERTTATVTVTSTRRASEAAEAPEPKPEGSPAEPAPAAN